MEAESSKDLLQRFAGSTTLSDRPPPTPATSHAIDDVELSLGLSLGGCFSSNPREKANKLIRSSSISAFPFFDSIKDENFQVAPTQLQRTCSLPVTGIDEDYRKRKELQSLKRLEAKRKRSEKRNSLKGDDSARLPPISQNSIGSVGSSSSSGGGSMQGFVGYGFNIVKFSNCSEDTDHRANTRENTLKRIGRRGSGTTEMGRSMAEEMPCVSTRGNGPNGKRIEGFLYKYRKGEEVRIVCVCHGNFLTPAEFVRHAGGGDVDHPLKHIVVNPPSPFL